jgi:hypothetical protein
MKSGLRIGLALAGLLVAGSAGAAGKRSDSVVEIENASLWDIHQLFLSPVSDEEWGPDQLGKQIIASGETYRLTDIPCDDYDVRLVDEDGDVCVVRAVALCGDRDTWRITDDDLLSCQVQTDE